MADKNMAVGKESEKMKGKQKAGGTYEKLKPYLEQAMALQTALMLFEWDNETLAPKKAGPYTAKVQGALSVLYQDLMAGEPVKSLLSQCQEEEGLTEAERAIVREAVEEKERLECIPPDEYRAFQELVSKSTRIWAKAREGQDFEAFAPTLEKIIFYQKKFAGYRAKKGQKLYDVMLDHYEKGFSMEKLDEFFGLLKKELVPLLHRIQDSGVEVETGFLKGGYPPEKQDRKSVV